MRETPSSPIFISFSRHPIQKLVLKITEQPLDFYSLSTIYHPSIKLFSLYLDYFDYALRINLVPSVPFYTPSPNGEKDNNNGYGDTYDSDPQSFVYPSTFPSPLIRIIAPPFLPNIWFEFQCVYVNDTQYCIITY